MNTNPGKTPALQHIDKLEDLNRHLPLKHKLASTHRTIQASLPFIARIAVALYDPETRILKSFIHSDEHEHPLEHQQMLLDEAPSLKHILDKGLPRIINHQLTHDRGDDKDEGRHRVGRSGYAASYTMPMFNDGDFFGFIFFNSREPDVFDEHVLGQVDVFGHMISLMIINELSNIQTLTAALKTTARIAHLRDPETGSHLDRMSRYSRLIADALAEHYDLDDEYIEYIFMFSPLHDIGKIGIPDDILMKPDRLEPDEMSVMRTHTTKGRQIIDEILSNFGLEGIDHIEVLRNIAEYHHEAIDGNGYPTGRSGDDIPLEARIVAVADIFDALTSTRPYKQAWSNQQAFDMLRELAGERLDRECVQALLDNADAIERIQSQFNEDYFG